MTSQMPRPLVAGNWKMNGLTRSLPVAGEIADGFGAALRERVDLLICPPATLIAPMAAVLSGKGIALGGQDCHARESGAFTGNVSAEMLADAGARYVIVGHSERRTYEGETDAQVKDKAEAARRAGLIAILCVGETREEREAGRALDVVRTQLRGGLPEGASAATLVVAYEPVWAIGTGLVPTVGDVAEVHALIRETLGEAMTAGDQAGTRILYGGSVKPENAGELLAVANVDGALVGGASLKAADFLGIAGAYATIAR